jgi:hypothetical protein
MRFQESIDSRSKSRSQEPEGGESCRNIARCPRPILHVPPPICWSSYARTSSLDTLRDPIRSMSTPSFSSNTLFCKSHNRTPFRSTEIGLLLRRHARYSNILGYLFQFHQPSFGTENKRPPSKSNVHSRHFLTTSWISIFYFFCLLSQ